MRSAVWPQPDPRTRATSWVGAPVRSAMTVAAALATSKGSVAGSLRSTTHATHPSGRSGRDSLRWLDGGVMGHPTSVVVLGGGPGGYEAALVAARLGASVTVVDRDGLGGACVLTDCVPSKALISTAGFVTNRASGGRPRGRPGRCRRVDLATANRRILDLAEAQSNDIAARLTGDGVRIVRGTGTLARGRRGAGHGSRRDRRGPRRRGGAARHRFDAAHHADRAAGRRADPHLAADLLAHRAAGAPRRRRVRRHGGRAGPRLRRPRRSRHPGLLARPCPARRGRGRGHGHRGRVPARRHGGARPVADGRASSAPPTGYA